MASDILANIGSCNSLMPTGLAAITWAMLAYCWPDLQEETPVKYKYFLSSKWILKCGLLKPAICSSLEISTYPYKISIYECPYISFIHCCLKFYWLWIKAFIITQIHDRQKIADIWTPQWKHSHLIFWFAENGLASTINKYCHFNATLVSSAMDDKCNLQSPKLEIHNRITGTHDF